MSILSYEPKLEFKHQDFTNTKRNALTISVHAIFWLVFLSIPTFFNSRRFGTGLSKFVLDLLEPPRFANGLFFISVFYINTQFIIPRFYFKHKYIQLVLCLIATFCSFYLLNDLLTPAEVRVLPSFTPLGNSFNLFMFIITYAFSFIICLYQQYLRVKEDRLNTKISFLTAQINPHFLFNSLNSIHALSLVKSDKVSDAIVKLSGIMRYSISEGNQTKVELSKETNYISNYIELQKLRLTDEVIVLVKLNIERPGLWIAPFLLIPFIENAFKHGVCSDVESEIEIKIDVHEYSMDLFVCNDIVPTRNREQGTGLGIKTTEQRLKLLYANRHLLNIENNGKKFIVKLHLELS